MLRETELEEFTRLTITDPARLVDELTHTRERGFAIDNQERNVGLRCIAATVRNWTGKAVAGISISGPLARIEDGQVDGLADAVKSAAQSLSAALGADA